MPESGQLVLACMHTCTPCSTISEGKKFMYVVMFCTQCNPIFGIAKDPGLQVCVFYYFRASLEISSIL